MLEVHEPIEIIQITIKDKSTNKMKYAKLACYILFKIFAFFKAASKENEF